MIMAEVIEICIPWSGAGADVGPAAELGRSWGPDHGQIYFVWAFSNAPSQHRTGNLIFPLALLLSIARTIRSFLVSLVCRT